MAEIRRKVYCCHAAAAELALGWLSSFGVATVPGKQIQLNRADVSPTRGALASPRTLRNLSSRPHIVEVSITAAPARLPLRPGVMSDVFANNGQIPGPTLEVRE